MKRRVRKIANFFAFNLLFFALYLNFIHKDKITTPDMNQAATEQNTAAFSGTVLVDNPEQVIEKKNESVVTTEQPSEGNPAASNAVLRLSIN